MVSIDDIQFAYEHISEWESARIAETIQVNTVVVCCLCFESIGGIVWKSGSFYWCRPCHDKMHRIYGTHKLGEGFGDGDWSRPVSPMTMPKPIRLYGPIEDKNESG